MVFRRGLTLAELVVSMFVLTGAIIVVTQLFHASWRRSTVAGERARAAMAAHRKLAEIREWAEGQSGGGYNFDNWALYADQTSTDPVEPEFTIRVRSSDHPVGSPSTQLESTLAERRTFARSLRLVDITVTWPGGEPFRMVSLVGDPPRELAAPPVEVTPAAALPNPVPAGDPVDFQAELLDRYGRPIPDVVFRFAVEPGTGDGIIERTRRDGRLATFKNEYRRWDDSPVQVPGTCRVQASTRYHGANVDGLGPQLQLSP